MKLVLLAMCAPPGKTAGPAYWRRRLAGIANCATEPTELLVAVSMLLAAYVLLHSSADAVLPFPRVFGWLLLCGGLTGWLGVLTAWPAAKVAFGFLGMLLRVFVSTAYFQNNPYDPAWATLSVSAGACLWIFMRHFCAEMKRHGSRRREPCEPVPIAARIQGRAIERRRERREDAGKCSSTAGGFR